MRKSDLDYVVDTIETVIQGEIDLAKVEHLDHVVVSLDIVRARLLHVLKKSGEGVDER